MQVSQGNLLMRDDTFLGVCEALGEDFGINSNLLRIAFAVPLLWNPTIVIGTYLALGILVMLTRLIIRSPRPAATDASSAAAEPVPDEADRDEDELAVAA